jgi:hypothetical protein
LAQRNRANDCSRADAVEDKHDPFDLDWLAQEEIGEQEMLKQSFESEYLQNEQKIDQCKKKKE